MQFEIKEYVLELFYNKMLNSGFVNFVKFGESKKGS